MVIVSFLLNLAGATMLLLYAVRMVRTGIERAFGPSFKQAVIGNRNRVSAATTGLVLAIILQSSAAVGLLVAGFSSAGALSFGAGLSVVLGADLGSALLIQVFSFDLSWLLPVLLAVGGGLFVKAERRGLRQAGRILLGVAFILISLRFLRETMDPIRDSSFLPAIAGYLAKDYITAFIVGATLAFAMHSSVAAILMCVTLVSVGAIPVVAGVSLVLGANLGSALIPVWLTRSMSNEARRVPAGNLAVRGTGALAALVLMNETDLLAHVGPPGSAQTLINMHILFNAALLVMLLVANRLEAPFRSLFPDEAPVFDDQSPLYRCTLEDSAVERPHLAIANLRREILRMVQLVETMITPALDLYRKYDPDQARHVVAQDGYVNAALDDVRRFAAAVQGSGALEKSDNKRLRELAEFAIAVETAGDIVVKRLVPLAKEKSEQGVRFSESGMSEIATMHRQVLANILLVSNVVVSDDMESARLLLEEKQEMARLERKSRKRHLRRLSEGVQISFESSDIHLETVGSLRDFNSHLASFAYPILHRGGQLLETRLIDQELDDPEVRQR